MATTTKLRLINDALGGTANGLISQANLDALDSDSPITDDNDPLYLADRASRIYDNELVLLLERHTWNFAIDTEALELAGDSENPSNRKSNAYYWPVLALWLQRVEAPGGAPLDYEIIGRYICMDYDGEDDAAPVATYIQKPPNSEISNLFWAILRGKIEVGILRTVNEDYAEATRRERMIEEVFLPLARTRGDQQNPPRKAFRSSMRERRRAGGGPRAL